MSKKTFYFLLLTVGFFVAPTLRAQEKPATGPRAEFLAELSYYEDRFIRLAEAVPADKYNWRPAEGVRSIGEVYAHIVAANYGIARAFGTQPPSGIDFKAIT